MSKATISPGGSRGLHWLVSERSVWIIRLKLKN